ncbi:MAG: hypothetical protein IPK82_13310 [Polyangiaceae bacterium]|nr:hypothetical protein [Polyangiaceae bacterium]
MEQLYLEARIVRQDALSKLTADGETTTRARLSDDALSMSTDVRNVFRLRSPQ